ncbi:MAG: hypothetical protein J7L44_01770 [Candidatus Diapherotrites archaeon]|nr:hypothetical protein [Candidatus Diapherotrites archaeon]
MGFISKSNGLFLYVVGLTIMFITYAFLESAARDNVYAGPKLVASLVVLIKLFYAMATLFIILGIFIFAISSFNPRKERFIVG